MTCIIETVVVPLDGSALAERALPLAGSIAARAGAALHLVYVVPEPVDTAQAEHINDRLRQAAERANVPGTPIVRCGPPVDQILAAVSGLPHPLIIMTTHGRSGIGRWLVGSVAARVVREGDVPVLLLRSETATTSEPIVIRRIMVPLDGTSAAEAALPWATTLATLFDAELRLVRVAETGHLAATFDTTLLPLPADLIPQLARDLVDAADRYLADTSARLRSPDLRVYPVTLQGFPAKELLAQEQDALIDLVVMTTHARSGVGRMVFGSVAEELLQAGQRPILMLHPVAERASSQPR